MAALDFARLDIKHLIQKANMDDTPLDLPPPPAYADVPYADATREPRHIGDVHLPARISRSPVLMIHGGSWRGLDKESMITFIPLFLRDERAVFNIHYRLIGQAPWPACGDDCVLAARFLLSGGLAEYGIPKPERIVICGASAGGHLTLFTGVSVPAPQVEAIISLAGPSRLDPRDDGPKSVLTREGGIQQAFFGCAPTPEMYAAASPSALVRPGAAPLYCIHSTNDLLVPVTHSQEAVDAWHHVGAKAEVRTFAGPGDSHGFWDRSDHNSRRLIPEFKAIVEDVIRDLHSK